MANGDKSVPQEVTFDAPVTGGAPPQTVTFDQPPKKETPGFGERFSEVTLGTRSPVEQAKSEVGMLRENPLGTIGQAAKTAAMAPVNLAYNVVHHPLDTITGLTGGPQFSEDVASGNWRGAAGDVAGGFVNAATLAEVPAGESGTLGRIGAEGVTSGVDAAKTSLAEATRMEKPFNKLTPGTRAVATTGAGALGYIGGEMIGHPYLGGAAGARMGPTIADWILPKRKPPPIRSVPFEEAAPVETGGTSGKIIGPETKPPAAAGSEGTAARWTNERVRELAAQGNRTAIEQANRRGIPLPENARYVMGDVDYPRTVLNPKETTTFAPTSTPVRDMARPPKSTGALLQIPRSPAVRESVPFGGPADTSAAERILDDPLATGAQKQAARHFLGMSP